MKKLITFLALISLTIFFIFSCQKDKPTTYPGGNSSYTSIRTTVTGMVLDESNAPLTGVTVTAYGQTTTTNQYGTFVLKNINVNKDRCVLQFTKTGFFKRAHGFIASANTVNYVRIILLSNAATQNFSASAGGTISLADGSSVLFQPNSIVTTNGSAYTGTVNLIVKHLSPDDVNFGFTIPGGDLLGKDLNDNDVALYTYGMLGVELTGSSSEALQLAAGTSATLTMAIAASQLSTAPASIPLWYFDETTSVWKEEGAANKVGNNYVGAVAHFSWWNYDYQGPRAYIKGKIVDCNGTPMPNINVTVNGWNVMTTDQNGEFYDAVPCGMTFTVQVLASNNPVITQNSLVENVPILASNQIFTIPDLNIYCVSRVKGLIKNCSGESTDGLAILSNSAFTSFQYTTDGSFNLPSKDNLSVTLKVIHLNFFHEQNITTLVAPNVLNVGNLLLCDSTLYENNFVLTAGPFAGQLFNIALSDTITAGFFPANGSYVALIYGAGYADPNFNIYHYEIQIHDTIPGPTTCNINIQMFDTINNTFSYHIGADTIPCNLIQSGPVGSYLQGTYSGNADLWSNSFYQGNISGSFKVIRKS